MIKSSDVLGREKIPRLIISLAIPAIIAQIVNLVYSLVDRIYIGRMENQTLAMSALVVSLPIITLITAFTSLIGTGGAPLAAIKLGQRDRPSANKILTNSFVCLTISGVVLTTGITLFQEPLLFAFGANNENIQYAKDYIGTYAYGTIFVQYTMGLNAYINTQGQVKLGMMTVLIGAVLNIILDPLFIFVLGMGIKGAAIATIIAQSVSAAWVLKFFFSHDSELQICKAYLRPDPKTVFAIMAMGISPFTMGITESLLQISFNNQLRAFGGTLTIAAFSIVSSCYSMGVTALNGLCQGTQPILSYNYGAGNLARVRYAFKMLLGINLFISFFGFGSFLLFPHVFASIFTTDVETIAFTAWALPVFCVGGLTFGLQIACQQSFLALGEAARSLWMTVFRKIVVLIPLIYLLPIWIGDTQFVLAYSEPIAQFANESGKVFAVLFAESISDVVAATATGTLFFRYYRRVLR